MVSTISTPQEHTFNKEREYGQFMDRVRSYLPEEDWPVIERAFALADKAHAHKTGFWRTVYLAPFRGCHHIERTTN